MRGSSKLGWSLQLLGLADVPPRELGQIGRASDRSGALAEAARALKLKLAESREMLGLGQRQGARCVDLIVGDREVRELRDLGRLSERCRTGGCDAVAVEA